MPLSHLALISGALLSLATLPALADDSDGFYVGIGFGQSRANVSASECQSRVQAAASALLPGSTATCTANGTDTAYKILAGYNITPHIGVEAGYLDFGQTNLSAIISVGGGSGRTELSQSATGAYADIVGNMQPSSNLDLFLKLGAYNASITSSNTVGISSSTHSNTNFTFGGGARFNFTENLGLRLEYEQFKDVGHGDNECSTCALALSYNISMINAAIIYGW